MKKSLASTVIMATAALQHPSTTALPPATSIRTQRRPQPWTAPAVLALSTVKEGTIESDLSPFLQEMVDEQRELQMKVGKALDVLRSDYPYFLKSAPDYSIYSTEISLTSQQTPIATSSLPSYQRAIAITRTMLNLLYDPDRSTVQNRMVYDSTRCQIRVSFHAELAPRNVLAPRAYVDGISVYSFDVGPMVVEGVRREEGGKIVEHRIESLLVNGVAGMPFPYLGGLEVMMGQQPGVGGALVGAGAWC
eukprot:CCRYP_015336-RA/>CCRYP_015336-RA protein AED:0.20 eAED:0.15 QI:0/0/0/1/1/1/2/0/248